MIRRAPGAPDFTPHIEELLKLAGIAGTPDTRNALDWFLQQGWVDSELERQRGKRAPPELFEQLETSIKKTQKLLRRLGKFPPTRNIEFDMGCYVGEGTISVASWQEGMELVLPRNPPPLDSYPEPIPTGATIAMINRQRVLDRLLRQLDVFNPKRKRGGQRNRTHRAVVARASHFFRQYSTAKLTTYPDGKFVPFCKLFYEIATGASGLDNHMLDTQIRAEVKSPQLGAKWIKS
jgi:hypothetical protein